MSDNLTDRGPDDAETAQPAVLIADGIRDQVLSQTRLKVAFVTITLALLVAFACTMFVSVDRIFSWLTPVAHRDLHWKAQRGISELSRAVDLGVMLGDSSVVRKVTADYEADPEVRLLEVRNVNDGLLYRHDKGGVPTAGLFRAAPHTIVEQSEHLYNWAPVEVEGQRIGRVALAISTARLQAGANLRADILRVALGACALGCALSLLFVHFYLRPLIGVTKQAFLDLERKTVEAVDAARVKGEFLANMSHEIRTPLNAVIGMLGLLVRGELSPRQQRRAEISESSARSLLALINDILDFSKLEAKQYVLHLAETDLQSLVRNRVELLAVKAHAKQLEIAYRFARDVPKHIAVDGDRLTQVLTNLVGNAVKFTQHGEISVSITCDRGAAPAEGEALLRFEVRDTGPGIAPEDQKHLFKSFSQVDGSATRAHEGTGLGLAISKHLITLMGGQIGLESTTGVGSTFWFTLPCHVVAQEREPEIRAGSTLGRRVLIADENATYRSILAEYMERWRMRVTMAQNSSEALTLARAARAADEPFEFAVIDLRLHDEHGRPLARVLKDEAGAALTIIQLTPALWRPGEQDATEIAYLAKPVRASDLYDRIVTPSGSETAVRGAARQRGMPLGARSGHILVVDDNEVNRVLAEELLRELNHTCDLAEGGKEAIEHAAARAYDAILMDCQMPGVNGYQATFEIRERERNHPRRTPIIALTAHAFAGEVQKVKAAGMDDLLTKPVTPQLLDTALQKWMAVAGSGRIRSLASAHAAVQEPAKPDPSAPAPANDVHTSTPADPAADQPVLVEQRRSARLLETFLRTVPANVEALAAASGGNDLTLIRGHAHKLKGSASSIGALRMSKLCEAIQHAADRGEREPLARWSQLVVQALAEVSEQLESELRRKQA